ncbi:hypothetical protein [Tenacibaculum sp. nBUS_03]|uniref:hypothetical protein n=1 Tax=Tenacibaculum sp. nBUS_03 TaxID=3395320 RepID=UPI003EBF265A
MTNINLKWVAVSTGCILSNTNDYNNGRIIFFPVIISLSESTKRKENWNSYNYTITKRIILMLKKISKINA